MAHFNTLSSSPTLLRVTGAIVASLSLVSCALTYQIAHIEAWVVDAETGAPIEGAVVTANWELVKGSLDGPRYFGQLEVKETVTDKNGQFHFDGFTKEDSSGAELRESDPQILIFKAGYEFQRFVNDYRDGGAGMKSLERTAAVDGKTVRLRRLPETLENRSTVYRGLDLRLRGVVEDCHWKKIPNAIRVMDDEYRRLTSSFPNVFFDLIRKGTLDSYREKCGPTNEIFKAK